MFNVIAVLLIIASLISVSPLILNYAPIPPNQLSLLALLIIFVFKIKSSFKYHKVAITSICFLIILGLLHSLYWQEFTLLLPIYFYSIFFILFSFSKSELFEYTNYLSLILMVMLIFSLVGFIYASLGYPPMFSIPNEDSRLNGFYLTTFSNTYLSGFIRPSGLFDEPGALSFFICMTVALRESFGMERKTSWTLLLLGLITSSIMHFIFMVIFLLKTKFLSLKRIFNSFLKILAIIFILLFLEHSVFNAIISSLISKFQLFEGRLAADNRSILFFNALDYLNLKVFFFGLDVDCMVNFDSCSLKGYEQYGENPLTLLVHWGIFLALPYYLVMTYLIIRSIINKDLVMFGIFLLLLQRPNIMSYGYAVIIFIYLYSIGQSKKQNIIARFL